MVRCGLKGSYCTSILDFPVCDPGDKAWKVLSTIYGMSEEGVLEGANTKMTSDRPAGPPNAYTLICRADKNAEGKTYPELFLYQFKGTAAEYQARFNVNDGSKHQFTQWQKGIELSPEELGAISKTLNDNGIRFTSDDHYCFDEKCALFANQKGMVMFKENAERLQWYIDVLSSTENIPGLSEPRREEVVAYLKSAHKKLKTVLDQAGDNFWLQIGLGVFSLVGMGGVFGLLNYWQMRRQEKMFKEQMEAMQASVKVAERQMELMKEDPPKLEDFTQDMVETTQKQIADGSFKPILGRDKEALEYLRALARNKRANPLLIGESGVGKDVIILRAAQLIATNDPRVPKCFLGENARRILRVDGIAFQAGTKYRGTSADRMEILKRAMNAGHVPYISEWADLMSAGSAEGAASEALGSMLKPVIDGSVAAGAEGMRLPSISGSTTPANLRRLLQDPVFRDLYRRTVQIKVKELPMSEVQNLIMKSSIPSLIKSIAKEHSVAVEFASDALEAIFNEGVRYIDQLARENRASRSLIDGLESLLQQVAEYKIFPDGDGQALEKQMAITREDVLGFLDAMAHIGNGEAAEAESELPEEIRHLSPADRVLLQEHVLQAIEDPEFVERYIRDDRLSSEGLVEVMRRAGMQLRPVTGGERPQSDEDRKKEEARRRGEAGGEFDGKGK